MKYKDKEFVEFFRRVLDFPRRGLLNAQDPNFMKVINDTVAVAAGAKIYLPPETFLTLRRPVTSRATQPKHLSARAQAYDPPRMRRGRTSLHQPMQYVPTWGKRLCPIQDKQRIHQPRRSLRHLSCFFQSSYLLTDLPQITLIVHLMTLKEN